VTDVKPLASVVTYTDEESGLEIYQEVLGRTFMPLDRAPEAAAAAAAAGAGGAAPTAAGGAGRAPPVMQTRGSKFVKFQEARIQELASEVPQGSTPRTLSVHLRGDICRTLKPGDEVELAGIFLPEPFTGYRAMRCVL